MSEEPTASASNLHFDGEAVGRVATQLYELSLRWLPAATHPTVRPCFGRDPIGAELSAALPVLVDRVIEARAHCCALLDAATTALQRACGDVDQLESGIARSGAPR
ncbi:MAG: hypothetical protein INR72_13990 [Williamsia herbipolensis]|nr:hypothetical protein [Williamsia herbipolensis]